MDNNERIGKLEQEVRITQDSVLLIHKDLQQMSQSMTKLVNAVELMATIQTNQKVMEERCETRNTSLKEADKLLHKRIDEIEKPARDGGVAWGVIKWTGITFGTLLAGLMFSAFVWVITQTGGQ